MKPYYHDNLVWWYNKDCSDMGELPDESIDLIATDPPYGISFMGKDWDRALPDRRIWTECLRVLKPGAFAFVMCIPRSDCLSRMIISLEDAGFLVNFTPIFWAYASGFPKAQNIGKAVDKRLGVEREVIRTEDRRSEYDGRERQSQAINLNWREAEGRTDVRDIAIREITEPATPQSKALDGSYGGFQPKPAVEVIIVAMKPLSEKTFVDQALKNRKGITWLDDGRIPYESEGDKMFNRRPNLYDKKYAPKGSSLRPHNAGGHEPPSPAGRFPANLLCSDDVLNDGNQHKGTIDRSIFSGKTNSAFGLKEHRRFTRGDSGSFSRYFDLDKWWAKTFPFLIVPKASKSEKNRGLGIAVPRTTHGSTPRRNESENKSPNYHPTVKPVKLMSYLITLGSREGDTVLDNFGGSGTTAVAARLLGRKCVMYEIKQRYCEIAVYRLRQMVLGWR